MQQPSMIDSVQSDAGALPSEVRLPIHLSRLVGECLNADYDDFAARTHLKAQCIPFLGQHRRELLAGSFVGRHSRPPGYLEMIRQKAKLIRDVLTHAHQEISSREQSNVVSFADALSKRV